MQERTKSEEEDRARTDSLTELIRTGAQKLLAQALQAEVAELLVVYEDQQDEQGHARVVLSGHHPTRDIQTGIGPVTVQVPKVRSRQGDPVTFRSALVPPYVRKTASLEAAIPWLYLKGISTGEMQPALEVGPGMYLIDILGKYRRNPSGSYTTSRERHVVSRGLFCSHMSHYLTLVPEYRKQIFLSALLNTLIDLKNLRKSFFGFAKLTFKSATFVTPAEIVRSFRRAQLFKIPTSNKE